MKIQVHTKTGGTGDKSYSSTVCTEKSWEYNKHKQAQSMTVRCIYIYIYMYEGMHFVCMLKKLYVFIKGKNKKYIVLPTCTIYFIYSFLWLLLSIIISLQHKQFLIFLAIQLSYVWILQFCSSENIFILPLLLKIVFNIESVVDNFFFSQFKDDIPSFTRFHCFWLAVSHIMVPHNALFVYIFIGFLLPFWFLKFDNDVHRCNYLLFWSLMSFLDLWTFFPSLKLNLKFFQTLFLHSFTLPFHFGTSITNISFYLILFYMSLKLSTFHHLFSCLFFRLIIDLPWGSLTLCSLLLAVKPI